MQENYVYSLRTAADRDDEMGQYLIYRNSPICRLYLSKTAKLSRASNNSVVRLLGHTAMPGQSD